jgi:hypothetical protein
MKNLKFQFALAAMLLGFGGAVATAQHRSLVDQKWARNPVTGLYTNITGQNQGFEYDCDHSSDVCTATYPPGQDPNSNPASPISVEEGLFN